METPLTRYEDPWRFSALISATMEILLLIMLLVSFSLSLVTSFLVKISGLDPSCIFIGCSHRSLQCHHFRKSDNGKNNIASPFCYKGFSFPLNGISHDRFLVKDGHDIVKKAKKSGNDVVRFNACSRHCIEDPVRRGIDVGSLQNDVSLLHSEGHDVCFDVHDVGTLQMDNQDVGSLHNDDNDMDSHENYKRQTGSDEHDMGLLKKRGSQDEGFHGCDVGLVGNDGQEVNLDECIVASPQNDGQVVASYGHDVDSLQRSYAQDVRFYGYDVGSLETNDHEVRLEGHEMGPHQNDSYSPKRQCHENERELECLKREELNYVPSKDDKIHQDSRSLGFVQMYIQRDSSKSLDRGPIHVNDALEIETYSDDGRADDSAYHDGTWSGVDDDMSEELFEIPLFLCGLGQTSKSETFSQPSSQCFGDDAFMKRKKEEIDSLGNGEDAVEKKEVSSSLDALLDEKHDNVQKRTLELVEKGVFSLEVPVKDENCLVDDDDDGDEGLNSLKEALKVERATLASLEAELENERNASAIATSEAMAMISRLQEEKSVMQMEVAQLQRMFEEKANYDGEAITFLKESLLKRERENLALEKEIELYKERLFAQVVRNGLIMHSPKNLSVYNESNEKEELVSIVDNFEECSREINSVFNVCDNNIPQILERLWLLEEQLQTLHESDEEIIRKRGLKSYKTQGECCEMNTELWDFKASLISHKCSGEEEDVNEGSLPIHDIYEVHSALPVEEKSKYGDRGYDNVALCVVKESLGQGEYPGSGSEYMDSSIDNNHNETNMARQLISRLEALEADRSIVRDATSLLKHRDVETTLLQEICRHLRELRISGFMKGYVSTLIGDLSLEKGASKKRRWSIG